MVPQKKNWVSRKTVPMSLIKIGNKKSRWEICRSPALTYTDVTLLRWSHTHRNIPTYIPTFHIFSINIFNNTLSKGSLERGEHVCVYIFPSFKSPISIKGNTNRLVAADLMMTNPCSRRTILWTHNVLSLSTITLSVNSTWFRSSRRQHRHQTSM